MAAGLGFKDFTTGEVLTAADVDGYLMQGIWVFANSTARDAAVTSPQEGNACYLKDTDVIQVYTGSTWAAQSASNPISANIVDAKGDIIAATAADTVSRLAVGANNTVLTADSSTATGLKWAAPISGLTLINTTSFSGVTSQSINDVFSTTYDNYTILLKLTSASNQRVGVRMRVSGADATGSNYTHIIQFNNGTTNTVATATETYFYSGYSYSSLTANVINIFSPFLAENTQMVSLSRSGTGGETITMTGVHALATSYTGLTVFGVAAGNINGTISIYGNGK